MAGAVRALVRAKSAWDATGVSLSARLSSVCSSGVALTTAAVLVRTPVRSAATVPVTVTVALASGGREARVQDAVASSQLQPSPLMAVRLTPSGSVSVRTRSVAVDGPWLVVVTPHVTVWPAMAGLGLPTDLVTSRSTAGATTVVTLEMLLSVLGWGVADSTVAVLDRSVVTAGSSSAVTVMNTSSFTAISAPAHSTSRPVTVHVHPETLMSAVTASRPAGRVSRTTTARPTEGPKLCTWRR